MEAIKFKTHLDSYTIQIPKLKESILGKDVEIIILVKPNKNKEESNSNLKTRKPGSAIGKIEIESDFHLPLNDDITEEFYK